MSEIILDIRIVVRWFLYLFSISCAVLMVWYFIKHVVFQKCPPKRKN